MPIKYAKDGHAQARVQAAVVRIFARGIRWVFAGGEGKRLGRSSGGRYLSRGTLHDGRALGGRNIRLNRPDTTTGLRTDRTYPLQQQEKKPDGV